MNEENIYFDGQIRPQWQTGATVEASTEIDISNAVDLVNLKQTNSINYYTAILAIILAVAALSFQVIQEFVRQGNNCLGVYSKCLQKNRQEKCTTFFLFANLVKNSKVLGSNNKSIAPIIISYDQSKKDIAIENACVCPLYTCTIDDEKNNKKDFAKPKVDHNTKCVKIAFKRLAYGDYFIVKIEHRGDLQKSAKVICNIFNCKTPYINKSHLTLGNFFIVAFTLILLVMTIVFFKNREVIMGTITTILFAMYIGLWIYLKRISVTKIMRDKLNRIINENMETD